MIDAISKSQPYVSLREGRFGTEELNCLQRVARKWLWWYPETHLSTLVEEVFHQALAHPSELAPAQREQFLKLIGKANKGHAYTYGTGYNWFFDHLILGATFRVGLRCAITKTQTADHRQARSVSKISFIIDKTHHLCHSLKGKLCLDISRKDRELAVTCSQDDKDLLLQDAGVRLLAKILRDSPTIERIRYQLSQVQRAKVYEKLFDGWSTEDSRRSSSSTITFSRLVTAKLRPKM